MLATVQKYHDAATLPPIRATIVAGNNDVGIRISDQGMCVSNYFVRGTYHKPYYRRRSFLFLKSNLRLTSSRSRTSETPHVWSTLALGHCER
jgi:hypothetical protein